MIINTDTVNEMQCNKCKYNWMQCDKWNVRNAMQQIDFNEYNVTNTM